MPHDHEENKLSITINTNTGAHTLTHDKIMKSPFGMSNVATKINKQNSNKDYVTGPCRIDTVVTM